MRKILLLASFFMLLFLFPSFAATLPSTDYYDGPYQVDNSENGYYSDFDFYNYSDYDLTNSFTAQGVNGRPCGDDADYYCPTCSSESTCLDYVRCLQKHSGCVEDVCDQKTKQPCMDRTCQIHYEESLGGPFCTLIDDPTQPCPVPIPNGFIVLLLMSLSYMIFKLRRKSLLKKAIK